MILLKASQINAAATLLSKDWLPITLKKRLLKGTLDLIRENQDKRKSRLESLLDSGSNFDGNN